MRNRHSVEVPREQRVAWIEPNASFKGDEPLSRFAKLSAPPPSSLRNSSDRRPTEPAFALIATAKSCSAENPNSP